VPGEDLRVDFINPLEQ